MMYLARRAIIIIIALVITGPAVAGDEAINVFNQLSADYADCFAYNMFAKQCAPGNATQEQLEEVQTRIDAALDGMVMTGRVAGLSDEALAARTELAVQSVGALMQEKCVNFSALIVKYADFCRNLQHDLSRRAKEICEQLYPGRSVCERVAK